MSYCRPDRDETDFFLGRVQENSAPLGAVYVCRNDSGHEETFSSAADLLAHANAHIAAGATIPSFAVQKIEARAAMEESDGQ